MKGHVLQLLLLQVKISGYVQFVENNHKDGL